jgi:starvation-inducible DNA-binding protein
MMARSPAPARFFQCTEQENDMNTPLQLKTPTDLERHSALSVAEALNGILADSYALYVKTKNFHWHVSGPHFRDYHRLLDEQAAQILATTDAMAERVRKTGGTTVRSIGHIARLQRIDDSDAEFVPARDMLAELHRDNLELVEYLREAKEVADAAADNATAGMIDDWTDQAEERAWFLFETTRVA